MKVHFFPGPLASEPQQDEPEHNEAVLRVGDDVEIVIVPSDIRRLVRPGHHKKYVNECPPSQQQAEVQVSKPGAHLAAFAVRLESQRGYERNAPQEEQNVAWIQPGQRLMKINLVVGPFKLSDHP